MSSADEDNPISDLMDEGNAVPPPLFGGEGSSSSPQSHRNENFSTAEIVFRILRFGSEQSNDPKLISSVMKQELESHPISLVDDVIHSIFLSASPPTEDVDPEIFLQSLPKQSGSKCRCDSQWYATEGVENIAFGCKTCALSSASCICVSCFEAGDHEGHDFYVSKSDYGCCDCGDIYAWKKSGFCKHHTGPSASDDPSIRLVEWTITIAKAFLYTVERIATSSHSTNPQLVSKLFAGIIKLNSYHDGFRRLAGRFFRINSDGQTFVDFFLPISHTLTPLLRQSWTNLIVDLMLDLEFKAEFSVLFSAHYTDMIIDRIGLVEPESGRRLMTDIGDFTCQMLTRPDVAMRLVTTESFIEKLFKTISKILQQSQIVFDPTTIDSGPAHGSANAYLRSILDQVASGNATLEFVEQATDQVANLLTFDEDEDESGVGQTLEGTANEPSPTESLLTILDHSHQLVKHHETIQSSIDVSYILDHPQVAELVISDEKLSSEYFSNWINIIKQLQFMNPHKRRTDVHVEFPDSNWSNALITQADLLFSFWLIRSAYRQIALTTTIINSVDLVQKRLSNWLNQTSTVLSEWIAKFSQYDTTNIFSLHCPLNRVFGLLSIELANIVSRSDSPLPIIPTSFLVAPLMSRMFASQAALGMWRRNGESVNMEFEFYKATLFHHHLGTLDSQMIQYALISSKVVCEEFFTSLLVRADELFTPMADFEHEKLNSILWLLTELMSQQTQISYDEDELITHRVRSVLALQDKSFSALRDPLSERYTHTLMPKFLQNLESSLSQIASKSIENNLFKLNDREWFLVDLISPYWSLRDFEKGEENFLSHLKRTNMSLSEWWKCNRTMLPVIKPQYRSGFTNFISSPHILAIIFTSLIHVKDNPDDYRSLKFIVHILLRLNSLSFAPCWATAKSDKCCVKSSTGIENEKSHVSVAQVFKSFFDSYEKTQLHCSHPWSLEINSNSILSLLKQIEAREQSIDMKNWLNLVVTTISDICSATSITSFLPPPTTTDSSSSSSRSSKREAMQKKLLERLAKRQANFLSSSTPPQEDHSVNNNSHEAIDCVVCLSPNKDNGNSGHLLYLSSSPLGAFTPREFAPSVTSAALIPDESVDLKNFLPYVPAANSRIITRACGHKLHQNCWMKLCMQSRKGTINCPYCNRPANVLVGDLFVDGFDRVIEKLGIVCSGSLDPIVCVMSDLIDQIALSYRLPNPDSDMRSLTDAVGIIRKLFASRVGQLKVDDVGEKFSKSNNILQRCMFGNMTGEDFATLAQQHFKSEIAVYKTLIEEKIPNIGGTDSIDAIWQLAVRPWLFRIHLFLHLFVSPEHELPFEEINAVESALTIQDEFRLLCDQLPFTINFVATTTTTTPSHSLPRELPFLILNVSDQDSVVPGTIQKKFLDTYVKRERVKMIQIPDSSIVVVEYYPTIIPILSSIYQKMYTGYLHAKCVNCNTVPRLPVVCLLCGTLLCCNSSCCASEDGSPRESTLITIGEVSSHYKQTCAPNGGIGIFLQLSNSVVYLVGDDGKSIAPWGSLYLDSHGEEDFGLSKPLQLDVGGRLEKLRSEIRENSFIWKQSSKNFQWKPVGIL